MADSPVQPHVSEEALQAFAFSDSHSNLVGGLVLASRACVKLIDVSGRLVAINPMGRILMEIDDVSSICGEHWTLLWPEEERARIAATIDDALKGTSTCFTAFCPTAKGTPRWWDVTVTPVHDDAGAVTQILTCSYDITHMKEREAELEQLVAEKQRLLTSFAHQLDNEARRLSEARQRAGHAEKLHVVGQFVGHVVHDINNVLAVMQSASRLLRRRLSGHVEAEILEQVDRSVDRGKNLVRRLLDFSRADDEAVAEVFDPVAALEADADLLRHLVGTDAKLAIEVPAERWTIRTERHKYQSVIFNLASNARDAMADPGSVTVSIRHHRAGAHPQSLPAADYVEIAVADTGAGMPPDIVARAGQPFFTTKGEGKGTGLGLASAFDLAERCSGRVIIDSTVGKGTRVALYLPRADAEGETAHWRQPHPLDRHHGQATLLVVKLDAKARQRTASVLRGLGYVVLEASSEELALAAMLREVRIDLVISDLHLGRGSGVHLADRLRQDQPDLPVLFIGSESDAAASPPGASLLTRPVSDSALAQAVLENLGRLPASAMSGEILRRSLGLAERMSHPEMRKLLGDWVELCQSKGRLPTIAEASPLAASVADHSYVVAVLGGIDVPAFRFEQAGDMLKSRIGRDPVGEVITADDEAVIGRIGRAFRRCQTGMAHFDHSTVAIGDASDVVFERLVLPISSHGSEITHLIGVVMFKGLSSRS